MPDFIGAPRRGQFRSPTYARFPGGLNVRDFWHTLKDNELQTANNIRLDEGGVIRKRGGWAKLSTTAVGTDDNLTGVFHAEWVIAGVTTRKVIATDGVKIFHGAGGAWTDITGALSLSPNSDTLNSFVMFNNILVGYDGVNAPWQWNGAAAAATALGGSPPTADISIVWQGRLWFIKEGTVKLFYSDIGDPETWGASSFINIPSPFDGDGVTGLAILYGNLIVFKRNSIYIVQGDAPTNFVVSKTNSAIGCVSSYSVVSVDNLVYFVSDKGLYAMNLSNTKHLSYNVEPRYTLAVQNQTLGALARNKIQGVHYRRRNEIWQAIDATAGGQDHHDRTIVHNYAVLNDSGDPAVVEHFLGGDETAPAVLADYRNPTTGVISPMASFYDKYVYQFSESVTTDADAAGTDDFSSKFLTGYKDFGSSEATKTLRNIWTSIAFAGGTPKITIGVLSADLSVETTAELTPGTPSTFYNTKQPVGQIFTASRPQGKYFKFGMTSDDGGTFSFFETSFDVIMNGLRN